jgi:ABC-type multidrug transport system permease subunit
MATFASKADIANQVYTFTILPAFIQKISPWLPTTMFTELIRPLLENGTLAQGSWVNLVGLVGMTLAFSLLAARRFRWEKLES